jgi:hypothetical protein
MSLSDQALREIYRQQPSVRRRENLMRYALAARGVAADEISAVVEDLTDSLLVPPGTKATVRGGVFNQIVANYLRSLPICNRPGIVLAFEQFCPLAPTGEIPDWYVWDIGGNRALIGMNQVDLWSGGAQINRADKYVNAWLGENIAFVAVIANYYQIKTGGNRIAHMFDKAFGTRIAYVPMVESIITEFLDG